MELAKVWPKKPVKEKKEFVNLLVEKAVLSVGSIHWVKLVINWKHPAWPIETLYIRRRSGKPLKWTDEENELLRKSFVNGDKKSLLMQLPHRTWSAIGRQANVLGLRRTYMRVKLPIDDNTTWEDYEYCQAIGIDPRSRKTVVYVKGGGTNCGASSPSLACHRNY